MILKFTTIFGLSTTISKETSRKNKEAYQFNSFPFWSDSQYIDPININSEKYSVYNSRNSSHQDEPLVPN